VLAQGPQPTTFTDVETGIVFNSWRIASESSQTKGGFNFGVALPSNGLSVDADEFIGYLVGPLRVLFVNVY